ncbi:hypothetical protein BURMUCGD1_3886 [Burkholderia multivorans CGD1]|nr:hypothetical protein BURMUCGD1_3886 [Burkholderia multivorans CGD1]
MIVVASAVFVAFARNSMKLAEARRPRLQGRSANAACIGDRAVMGRASQ